MFVFSDPLDSNLAAGTLMDSSQLFVGKASKVWQHQVCPHKQVFRHFSPKVVCVHILKCLIYFHLHAKPKELKYIPQQTVLGTTVLNPVGVLRKLSFHSESVEILHLLTIKTNIQKLLLR